jgi:hypothetical protein
MAKRPTFGMSVGGDWMRPPSSSARRAAASTSSTEMCAIQCGGAGGYCITPPTCVSPASHTAYPFASSPKGCTVQPTAAV